MVITTFFMIVKEMYVNSSYIDITMIIAVKICPSIQFSQSSSNSYVIYGNTISNIW